MRQHPIPQNIMDVEFKLVGDLTLKQFAYAAIGFGLALLAFQSELGLFLKWPLIVFFSIAGVALAFVPFDDRSLDIWLFNYVNAIYRPQRRFWIKGDNLPAYLTTSSKHLSPKRDRGSKLHKQDTRFASYMDSQPLEENVADVLEQELQQRISTLFAEEARHQSAPKTIEAAPTITLTPPVSVPIATIERKKVEQAPQQRASAINYYEEDVIPIKQTAEGTTYRTPIQNVTAHRPLTLDDAAKQKRDALKQSRPKPAPQLKPVQQPVEQPEHPAEASKRNEELLTEVKGIINTLREYNASGDQPIIDPQAFPNLEPKKKLPIKEKKKKQAPPPPAQKVDEKEIKKEVPQQPLTSMKPVKTLPPVPTPEPPIAQQHAEKMGKLQEQNQEILTALTNTQKAVKKMASEQKKKPAEPLAPPPSPQQPIKEEVYKNKREELSAQLIKEKNQKEKVIPAKTLNQTPETTNTSTPLEPNIINGVVYNNLQESIESAIVIIKDEANIPKWASKTNKVGQFKMSSPVTNGKYRIEVKKPGHAFDTIEVEVAGTILQPIVITAK